MLLIKKAMKPQLVKPGMATKVAPVTPVSAAIVSIKIARCMVKFFLRDLRRFKAKLRHTLGFSFWVNLGRVSGPRIGIHDTDLDSTPRKMIALRQKLGFRTALHLSPPKS